MYLLYSDHQGDRIGDVSGSSQRFVTTPEQLARSIVRERGLQCVIVRRKRLDSEWIALLESIHRSFPNLPLYLVLPPDERNPTRIPHHYVEGDGEMRSLVMGLVSQSRVENRRRHPRLEWPLKGFVRLKGSEDGVALPVRSVSASGAFLESRDWKPEENQEAMLHIRFRDFNVLTDCTILSPRPARGALPAGVPVEFHNLSRTTQALLDEIVQDRLLQMLLPGNRDIEEPGLELQSD